MSLAGLVGVARQVQLGGANAAFNETMLDEVGHVDSAKAILLGQRLTAAGRYIVARAWDNSVSRARKMFGDSAVNYSDTAWAGCDKCRTIVGGVKVVDDSLRAVLATSKGNAEVQEYDRLTGGLGSDDALQRMMANIDTRAAVARFTRSPSQVLPLVATSSLQAFLNNRKEMVISYEESGGKNVVTVDLAGSVIQKVVEKCK